MRALPLPILLVSTLVACNGGDDTGDPPAGSDTGNDTGQPPDTGDTGSGSGDTADTGAPIPDCDDLNCDGLVDLVFVVEAESPAKVFWGSEDGYGASSADELPTDWARAVAMADLDLDGHLDLVFARNQEEGDYETDSVAIFTDREGEARKPGDTGSDTGSGPQEDAGIPLPTYGAMGVSVGDLDNDGWPDIVFSNHGSPDSPSTASPIYWGSETGFHVDDTTSLPTTGAHGNSVADLDGDGWLDIVFSSYSDGTTRELDSYVYWGSESGFDVANRTTLPTIGARGNLVYDLDGDGWLDIVFAGDATGTESSNHSYIYAGSDKGFDPEAVTRLSNTGGYSVAAEDLNQDGYVDLVFGNHRSDDEGSVSSAVFWGSEEGFSGENRTPLTTQKAGGLVLHDIDDDGWTDIVFANSGTVGDGEETSDAFVYLGGEEGFDQTSRSTLPVKGAIGVTAFVGESGY